MKTKHRGVLPVDFSSAEDFKSFVATNLVYWVSERGQSKKIVRTLAEAQQVVKVPGDFLELASNLDDLSNDVTNLRKNASSGLEQQTTRAIERDPALIELLGDLRALADGHSIVFIDSSNKHVLEVDGLVINSVCVLVNECKQSPTVSDVESLISRVGVFKTILRNCRGHTSYPPECIHELDGITEVVPVLSGFNFLPEVMAKCRAEGVRVMQTNGIGYTALD